MEKILVSSCLISGVLIIFGLIYLIIGITYKNWKKSLISILSLILGIAIYYLPYYFILNNVFKR